MQAIAHTQKLLIKETLKILKAETLKTANAMYPPDCFSFVIFYFAGFVPQRMDAVQLLVFAPIWSKYPEEQRGKKMCIFYLFDLLMYHKMSRCLLHRMVFAQAKPVLALHCGISALFIH